MFKHNALDFKKGDRVFYITMNQGCSLCEGEVTAVVRQAQCKTPSGLVIQPVVHVKYISPFGATWKRMFAKHFGLFQQDPYPMWQLRKADGLDFKQLRRTIQRIDKNYRKHRSDVECMERQLEHDAYEWKILERERRMKLIPHDWHYLNNALRRAGFPSPSGKER